MTTHTTQTDKAELIALGKAIRRLRKERKLTQEALALSSGVHISFVGAIERGQNNPTWLTLVKLAAVLEVTVEQLAAEAGL